MIIKQFQARNTKEQIAKAFNVSKKHANNAIKESRITVEIPKARKIGNPMKITSNIRDFIEIRPIQDYASTSEEIAEDIEKNFNVGFQSQVLETLVRNWNINRLDIWNDLLLRKKK